MFDINKKENNKEEKGEEYGDGKLLDFYRFFGNAKDTDSDLYKFVSSILSSNNNLNKISEYH